MRPKAALATLAVATAGSLAGGTGSQAKPPPLVALTTAGVAQVAPVTLQPIGRSLRLPFAWFAHALSPGGTRLAIASNNRGIVRLVDLKRMRALRDLRFTGVPESLFWLEPRLLVVELGTGRMVAVDPTTRRVRWRREIAGLIFSLARSPDGVVLLVAPDEEIGATTLVSVGRDGAVRSVVLDRILSGIHRDSDSDSSADVRWPGLAIDPVGHRAFVIGGGEPITEVDLTAMTVVNHRGSRVLAKAVDGPSREAHWLGNGLIAVTGTDSHRWIDRQGHEQETVVPAGLTLVDTRDWTSRQIDPSASTVVVADGLLLATGWAYDSTSDEMSGMGLTAYALDGELRFHVFDGTVGALQPARGMAYVWLPGPPHPGSSVSVVDLSSGHVRRVIPNSAVLLLVVR